MEKREKVNIDWNYNGKLDLALGNGATKAEKITGWSACFVIPAFLLYNVFIGRVEWSYWQLAVALFLAFDVGGGMVCNALNSCKRFYESPVKSDEDKYVSIIKNKFVFSAIHVHPIIVWLLFDRTNWIDGLIWYLLLMLSVFLTIKTPLYMKRPVSMFIILLAIMLNFYTIKPVIGFEWLIPVLFIKLVYGHSVREEPYRP